MKAGELSFENERKTILGNFDLRVKSEHYSPNTN